MNRTKSERRAFSDVARLQLGLSIGNCQTIDLAAIKYFDLREMAREERMLRQSKHSLNIRANWRVRMFAKFGIFLVNLGTRCTQTSATKKVSTWVETYHQDEFRLEAVRPSRRSR